MAGETKSDEVSLNTAAFTRYSPALTSRSIARPFVLDSHPAGAVLRFQPEGMTLGNAGSGDDRRAT